MSIYVKTPDRWEPLVEGSLEGAPGQPYILNLQGGSVVQFGPGVQGSAGPTIAYGAYITPSGDGATVEVDQETLEATVSGTEPFVNYVVSIYGVNAAGKGEPASTFPFQLNYNEATGGTVTVIDDFDGTGERWQAHLFTSSGDFTAVSSPQPFTYGMFAGGGGGGNGGSGSFGPQNGGRGGGGGYYSSTMTMDSGSVHTIYISAVAGNGGYTGNNGGSCTIDNSTNPYPGGGGGGSWGQDPYTGVYGLSGNPSPEADGGNGYGINGPPAATNPSSAGLAFWGAVPVPSNYGGAGGVGVGTGVPQPGTTGQKGSIVIAYQIGVSSTTQIKNAQAKQAARFQGHDDGYAEGFSEGYADFELPTYPDEDTE